MRMRIPLKKKQEAFRLRVQGKSYNEIRKILDLKSKGTLSYWFKDLKLSPKAEKRLENKIKIAQERGLLKFNKDRTRRIALENKRVRIEATKKISPLSSNDLFLIGVALYWGEGYQSERNKKFQALGFSNSNPAMATLFMKFLRETLGIDDEKIKVVVNIYSCHNEMKMSDFWSKALNLPKERLRFTRYVSGVSKFVRPKNFLPYGTVAIRINDRKLFFRMKGYIDGIIKQLRD